jgi:site-specific DNA-methyltransferase (adenine-specific)/adenine-specific DNA-methyltransferase
VETGADNVNRLILGDNLLVMRALPDESIDLIYIDPPFFTGREQRANGDAAHAFDDAWAGGLDAYLAWLRERVIEMRRLLRPTGVLYVHCDFHAGHYIKVLLDEVFGGERFQNEIIWHYGLGAANATRHFLRKHDTIFVYRKSDAATFNVVRGGVTPAMLAKYSHEDARGRYMMSRGRKYYLKGGKPLDSVWDIPAIAATSRERLGYPTQKPETLLERVILASSNEGDVVADFCCGSGTTPAVAQRLGRRWLACDASPAAVEITASRLARLCGAGAFAVERI